MPSLRIALSLVLALCFSSACLAEKKTHFIIGVENINLLPHFNNKDDVYYGFSKELLDLFAKKHAYSFSYKPLPLKRLFKDFVSQSVDFKYPDHPLWQKEIKAPVTVIYSQPIVAYTEGIMVLPERLGLGIEKLTDISLALGYTAWPYQQYIDNARIREWQTPNFQGAIKMVLSERVSGMYINISVGEYQLNHIFRKNNALIFDPDLPHISDFYYFSTINYPEIIEQMNRFLVTDKDAITALKIKHGIKESASFLP